MEEVYGPGDTLGDRAFLNAEPHHSTVTVATHCVALRIPAEELEGVFTKDPTIAGRFSQTVTRKLREARQTEAARPSRVRRIVSLMGLGPRVNTAAAVEKLAGTLTRLTRRQVLLVRLVKAAEAERFPSWQLPEHPLHGDFPFRRTVQQNVGGFQELRLEVGTDPRCAGEMAPLI